MISPCQRHDFTLTAKLWQNLEISILLSGYYLEAGYEPLEISERHGYSLETLRRDKAAKPHNDPFARMRIAQAKSENMLFLTQDSLLPDYNEACIISV